MFTEFPLLERPAAASAAGFGTVEFWWPFPEPVPPADELDAFVRALDDAHVDVSAINFFAGDMVAGERGLVSHRARQAEFRANVPVVVELARRTGARVFNALYGQRVTQSSPATQDTTAREALAYAARAVAAIDGTVVVEALKAGENGDYPLRTADDCVTLLQRVREHSGQRNIGLLFDTYHLASNGVDLPAAIAQHGDWIQHVQIADAPGRGQPGTGEIDFGGVLRALRAAGYQRDVACEYRPVGPSGQSLGWLDEDWARSLNSCAN
jgi:hydroxypyruvate isomerase